MAVNRPIPALPENVLVTRLDALGQLVPQEQPLADAVCDGLLWNRVDGDRREST